MAQPTIRSNLHPPGNEAQEHSILFDQNTDSMISHTITVQTEPTRVMAFSLTGLQYIEVEQVIGTGSGVEFQAFAPAGVPYRLTASTSSLVLEWAGRYRFRLVDDPESPGTALGTVKAIAYRFSMTHEWNYTLAQSLRELLARLNLSVDDTNTIDLTLTFDGISGQVLTADAIVSPDADNQLVAQPDGLKARAYVEAGTGITVTGVGTEGNPYVVANLCCEDGGPIAGDEGELCIQFYAGTATVPCSAVVPDDHLPHFVLVTLRGVNFGTPPYTVTSFSNTNIDISSFILSPSGTVVTPNAMFWQEDTGAPFTAADTITLNAAYVDYVNSLWDGSEDASMTISVPGNMSFTVTDNIGAVRTYYLPRNGLGGGSTDADLPCGYYPTARATPIERTYLIRGKDSQNCGSVGTSQAFDICVEPSSGVSDAGFSSPGTSLPDIALTAYDAAQTRFTVYVVVGNQVFNTPGPHEFDFSNVTVTAAWTSTLPDSGVCVQAPIASAVILSYKIGGTWYPQTSAPLYINNLSSVDAIYYAVTLQIEEGEPLDEDYVVTVQVDGFVRVRSLGNGTITNHYIPTGDAATIVCGNYLTNPGSAYTDQFTITGVAAPGGLYATMCLGPGDHHNIDLSAQPIATTERSMYVTMSGISGGLAPYSVDFSNVVFTGTCLEGATNRLVGITETSNVVGGVLTGGSATCTATLDVDTAAYDITQNGTASIGVAAGSYVEVTDSTPLTVAFYLPITPDDPESEYCDSLLVDLGDTYLDSWTLTGTTGGGGPQDPFGVGPGGGLYLSPTVGNPYEYFPGWIDNQIDYDVNNYPINRCTTANQNLMYRVPVAAVIRNITGGVPPYTVDFSGLLFVFEYDQIVYWPTCTTMLNTPVAVTTTYTGYTGGPSNPVRTGVPLGHTELWATPDQGNVDSYIVSNAQTKFRWKLSGSVVVTDSAMNTLTFSIPNASEGALGAIGPGGSAGVYTDEYIHESCDVQPPYYCT